MNSAKNFDRDKDYITLVDYLKDENVKTKLKSNITDLQEDVSRYLGDLSVVRPYVTDYTQLLFDTVLSITNKIDLSAVSKIDPTKSTKAHHPAIKKWFDLAIAIAIDDLFDSNGQIKPQILAALNGKINIASLSDKELAEIKAELINSYFLLINYHEAVINLDPNDTNKLVIFNHICNDIFTELRTVNLDKKYIENLHQTLHKYAQEDSKGDKDVTKLKEAIDYFFAVKALEPTLRKRKPPTDVTQCFDQTTFTFPMKLLPPLDDVDENQTLLWLDFAEAIAIDHLFDENGHIKKMIYQTLNVNNYLDAISAQFGENKVKAELLIAYLNSITEHEIQIHRDMVEKRIAAIRSSITLAEHIDKIENNLAMVYSLKKANENKLTQNIKTFIDDNFAKARENLNLTHTRFENESISAQKNDFASKILSKTLRKMTQGFDKIASTQPTTKPILTRAIKATNKFINDPKCKANTEHFVEHSKKISQYSWGTILAASMLTVAGIVLIAGSVTAAVASHGLAVPLTIVSFKLGLSLLSTAFAIGTGTGLASLAAGSYLGLFKSKKNEVLAEGDTINKVLHPKSSVKIK